MKIGDKVVVLQNFEFEGKDYKIGDIFNISYITKSGDFTIKGMDSNAYWTTTGGYFDLYKYKPLKTLIKQILTGS